MAWNREHLGDPAAAVNALDWSVAAMGEATCRLTQDMAMDLPHIVAAVSDAVWWVTIVDATLVRYRSASYDRVLAGRPAAQRTLIDETLAGLRYVRNHIDRHLDAEEFVRAAPGSASDDGTPAWIWNTLPEPACDLLSPRAQDWEIARYRAYETRLAGQAITATFALAAPFLAEAATPAENAPAGGTPSGSARTGLPRPVRQRPHPLTPHPPPRSAATRTP
jgi:hypothetical protein